VYSRLAST